MLSSLPPRVLASHLGQAEPGRLELGQHDANQDADIALLPTREVAPPGGSGTNWRVILYNDDWHYAEDVVEQLMKATECSPGEAIRIVTETSTKGRAVCYRHDREKCQRAAAVLREIRLQCEVDAD